MSTPPKASVHVKPCNIAQSERHNRRDAEYIKSLDPKKLYVRLDLSKYNSSYVAPETKDVTLQQHLESIRAMVKQKTGRSMQEKDVEYTDKNGKVRVRKGCSPIRECVVVINEDTRLKALLRFTRMVETRWGIKALQVHLHRDEGHYEIPGDDSTWKPNYHAHIIWDWMDHTTGKSIKLDADDMSAMQDMVAEALNMERGVKKSETGLDHLERNDFILQKQEKEKKRLEAEKRKIQSERDVAKNQARQATEEKTKAEKKAQEAKEEAQKAVAEKNEAEQKTKDAKTALASAESKITEKQSEIDRLQQRINIEQAALEGLQSEVEEKRREKDSIKTSDEWMNPALRAVSGYLVATDEVIKFAIEAIQDYAYSGTGGRGGNHGDCFRDNEAYIIKKVMTNLAAIAKTTFQVIGNWLVYVASRIARFNDWELNRAERGVKKVADGEYDWRIDSIDRGRSGGISR
jgi:DNA repair exonuclease SbcCD ATPase subunit